MVSPKSLENLKRGNPGNSGRPRAAVRDDYLKICEDSARFLAAVAAGKKVINADGKGKRRPTFDEQLKAIGLAMRYGMGNENSREAEGAFEPPIHWLGFDPSSIGSVTYLPKTDHGADVMVETTDGTTLWGTRMKMPGDD